MLLHAPVAMLLADELLAGARVLVGSVLEQIIKSAVKGLAYPVQLSNPIRSATSLYRLEIVVGRIPVSCDRRS